MRLHIAQWEGSGPAILLLHGMAANTHWWDDSAPLLASRFKPYALDLRGHGDSEWLEGTDYSTELFVEDIEQARKNLGLETMVLCAHSLGARLALEYARTHPQRLSALIAIDFLPEVSELIRASRLERFRNVRQPYFSEAETLIRRFHLEPPGTLLGAARLRALAALCVKQTDLGWTWKFDWKLFRYHYAPIWPILPEIRVPTLIIRGGKSTVMLQEHLSRVVSAMNASGGKAEAAVIAKAFHHIPLDTPAELAAEIIKFVIA